MPILSRGFSAPHSSGNAKLPPGQYLTTDFPVLSAGPTPHVSLDQWEFTISDGIKSLKRFDWKAFRELPSETIKVDLHCVVLLYEFRGVSEKLGAGMLWAFGELTYTPSWPMQCSIRTVATRQTFPLKMF